VLEKAREILRETPLIDGHNDLPWQYRKRVDNHLDRIDLASDTRELDPPMHTDIPRLRAGQLGGQFWSLYLPSSLEGPGAARALIEQIDVTRRMVDRYPDTFEPAASADDIERIFAAGKIASVLAIEGGYSIEGSLAVLRQAFDLGCRYMTLTHNDNTAWADSATDKPKHGGLTLFGREVVREMNRLGMMVDLSHVAPSTMHDAMDTSEAPVLFSHSSARALCDHPRNVPDEVLERIRDCGGLVNVTFVPPFLSENARHHRLAGEKERERLEKAAANAAASDPATGDGSGADGSESSGAAAETVLEDAERIDRLMDEWLEANPAPRATLSQVADHIDHIREVAGIDHVGIGSDFDGIKMVPVGLERGGRGGRPADPAVALGCPDRRDRPLAAPWSRASTFLEKAA